MILENPSERQIIEAWWQWINLAYPDVARASFHVPNEGKRSIQTCRILKNAGMTKGVADIIMLWPSSGYHGAVFEFKSLKGRLRPEQKAFLEHVKHCGYFTAIPRSIDEAIDITESYINEC